MTVTRTPDFWTPNELAEYLRVPVATIYTWNYTGTGPRYFKIGKHVRYRPEDVDAWLETRAEDNVA